MSVNRPIKRSPQLAPLSREHHDGLLYVWKIRQGLQNNTDLGLLRRYTLWYWKEHTKPHFFQEEKILLPHIPVGNPMAEQLKCEHAQIRELVLSLDREPDKETFVLLCDLAEKHIRWEERNVFPFIEETLPADVLTGIQKELEDHPLSCGEWTEVFWISKK